MTMERSALGVGGTDVAVPSHICLFHEGENDLRATQLAYLRLAIDDPRQAILLFGPSGAAQRQLGHLEADLGRSLSKEVMANRVVLAEGDDDPDLQLENLIGPIQYLVQEGYALVRVLGPVAWGVPNYPPPGDFLWYESRITPVISRWPVLVLCAYDVTQLPGSALAYGGLETHPQILTSGRLSASPIYVPPERFVSRRLMPLLNQPDGL
jgi:hypothetical protein